MKERAAKEGSGRRLEGERKAEGRGGKGKKEEGSGVGTLKEG